MELPARIREWAAWPGWRRHAPAAGSVAVHAVVGLAIVGLMAAAGRPLAPVRDPLPPALQVELVADAQPLPEMRPPPGRPAPRAPAPKSEPATDAAPPVAAPRKDEKKDVAAAPKPDSDSVYLGPSPFAQPALKGGLEGLASNDPCAVRIGVKPKDCGTNWAARVGSMDSVMPRSKEEMRQQHAEFIAPCPWKVGCEGGEWKSNNGTRSVFSSSGGPMMSGAGGVGGAGEMVGRLGFNPDHTDPGFGD